MTALLRVSGENSPRSRVPQFRIVGGRKAKPGEFPFIVFLSSETKFNESYITYNKCTGTILSSRWVLTAAHCVVNRNYTYVVPGKVNLDEYYANKDVYIRAYHLHMHPCYERLHDSEGRYLSVNDIAVIKTEKDMKLGIFAQLSPLSLEPRMSGKCLSVGFGRLYWTGDGPKWDMYLYVAELEYAAFKVDRYPSYYLSFYATTRFPSHGDSGGPLICDGEQRGVTNWVKNHEGKFEIVYVSPLHFRAWIQNVTGINPFTLNEAAFISSGFYPLYCVLHLLVSAFHAG